jgi:predicted flap endonuclease-1-like 5' DNA nuclease
MEPKQLGPVGGEGGNPFDAYDIPDDARLSAIHVYCEWVIDALRFDYVGAGGMADGRPPVGGLGGNHHVFYLDDDEFLIGLSGRCGWYVDGLRFHTNKRVSDLYGGQGGERDFALMAPPEYEISGLFGRSDWYVDALGVRVRPLAVRQELMEGAALVAEAEAEEAAEAAEMALDDVIDAVAAEIAAEADARRHLGVERGSEALAELIPDAEAMGGEMLSPVETAELEAVALDELVAALEEEMDAEQLGHTFEESLDMAVVSLTDDQDDEWDDEEGWEEWPEDGEPIDAAVVLRRAAVASEEAVEALEESATAEAIATLSDGQAGEGTVDVVVYTQVDETTPGHSVATVMAVARAAAEVDASLPDATVAETAVMVTDAIDDEDELLELEREAVEGAIESLEEDLGEMLGDADVSIYTGVTEDETGQTYGAVVAVATPILAAPGSDMPTATDRGSLAPAVVQLGGTAPRPQDLQLVEGIGPKIAAVLIEHGINDLGQLAATPVERLREILSGAGGRFRMADPGTWPRQAALGAAGDWAALTHLQTQLKAGK